MQLNLSTTATLGTKENFSTTFLLDNLDSLASNNSYQSLEFNNSTTGSAADQSFSSPMGPPLYASSPIARSPKQKRRKLKVISVNGNSLRASSPIWASEASLARTRVNERTNVNERTRRLVVAAKPFTLPNTSDVPVSPPCLRSPYKGVSLL